MSIRRMLKSAAVFFGLKPLRSGVWPDPAHLAATALLIHVARVDGELSERERRRVEAAVEAHFCGSRREARHLVARAKALDDETSELSSLLEMVGRDVTLRRRVLAMAFTIATADGVVGEVEADLVWRLGTMLGFDEREIEAIKETQALPTL